MRGKDDDGLSTERIVGVPMMEGDALVEVGLGSKSASQIQIMTNRN